MLSATLDVKPAELEDEKIRPQAPIALQSPHLSDQFASRAPSTTQTALAVNQHFSVWFPSFLCFGGRAVIAAYTMEENCTDFIEMSQFRVIFKTDPARPTAFG